MRYPHMVKALWLLCQRYEQQAIAAGFLERHDLAQRYWAKKREVGELAMALEKIDA